MQREECLLKPDPSSRTATRRSTQLGRDALPIAIFPTLPRQRPTAPYVGCAADIQALAPAHAVLPDTGHFSLAPDATRALQPPDSG